MISVYTDGACSQGSVNSGATWDGGWAFVILNSDGGIYSSDSGFVKQTTNSRMEIFPVIMALLRLGNDEDVEIVTDSQYVCNTINLWLKNWVDSGLMSSKANYDLWSRYLEIVSSRRGSVVARHIRGHGRDKNQNSIDTYYNSICDKLATDAMKNKRGINE